MTSFLLIISFLLHIILLIVVYQLYQQIQLIKKETNEDIEIVLMEFLEEIKKENNQLKQTISIEKQQQTVQASSPESQHIEKKPKKPSIEQASSPMPLDALLNKQADVVEQSEESIIIAKYEQGYSIEQIAKDLHRGKTEVTLLLKMYDKIE